MRTVKLLVNTTINGVCYEAGLEIQATEAEIKELVRLGSCIDEPVQVAVPQKTTAGKTPFFSKRR